MNENALVAAPVDLSIVITVHNEGLLLHRTLASVIEAVKYGRALDCTMEVIIVADRAGSTTRNFLATTRQLPEGTSVHEVDVGDPGDARNCGVALSRGAVVAFLDGDDLLTRDWPYRAWRAASKIDRQEHVAFHPEHMVTFDGQSFLSHHLSSSDPRFDSIVLAERNAWTAMLVARRRVLLDFPFTSASSDGFGFEDWHWVSELLAMGGRIECIPRTVGFIRRKRDGSRLSLQVDTHTLMRPTGLLRPSTIRRAPNRGDRVTLGEQHPRVSRSRALLQVVEQSGRRAVLRNPSLVPYVRPARAVLNRVDHRLTGRGWVPPPGVGRDIDSWLPTTCLDMHALDCAIFPYESLIRERWYVPWVKSDFAVAFEALCNAVDREVSHVLLVPWLKRGGADVVLLNYAEALDDLGYGESTVVLATEDAPSPWSSRLPRSVCFVDLGTIARRLDFDYSGRLLATFLIQAGPKVIHNINSRLGYAVFERYGKALTSMSQLYGCAFCEERTVDGRVCGYTFEEVPRLAESLTAILSDNLGILSRLHHQYGVPTEKMFAHRQPVRAAVGTARRTRSDVGRLRVLWAGRLDRQKRPDLLVAIAERCRGLNMEFDAFGAPVLASQSGWSRPRHSNVTFHGHYEDPSSMRWRDYDVFLNTSEWDGLPNVILEALSMDLPIVTSDVGGIAEAVGASAAGILISPFDRIDGYVEALRQLAEDPDRRREMGRRGSSYIASYHSREQFVDAVRTVPGYLPLMINARRSVNPGSSGDGSSVSIATAQPTERA